AIACKSGEVCSGGQCVQSCTNQCTFGATRCSGSGVQSCVQLPSGCTDWGSIAPCNSGDTCTGGACVPTSGCTKGARRCSGTTLEECDGQSWFTVQICPQSCAAAACSQTVQCSAGARRCGGAGGGASVEECNPSGTAWLFVRSCALGCQNGLCVGGCTAGERRCNGNVAEVCKSDGSGYNVDQSCSATFCQSGVCAKPSLLLDNTTVTMEGEHIYAGDVILKNNSQINIGPSGWLRIRAQNISIDATSSITAPAVGNFAGGAGFGGSKSCKSNYCSSTVSATIYSGGGYGAAGTNASKSLYNCYYSGSRYCTITASGGAANGGWLGEIHVGSSGGGCSQPNGGGMIDLIASTKVTMTGTLKADGGAGSSCGNGSGGGVRVVADDLTVDGVISAVAGGSGAGNGRIKLLYGAQKNINATISGVVEQSLIPPLDVRSSTHPDSKLVYNDGFEHVNVAWSKPFSNVAGYFYKVSSALPTAASHVPGAQDTWLAAESLSLTRADVQPGANYVQLVGVAPNASLGVVEAAFGITINDKPPTVSSSSHPAQSSWYTSGTVIFGWSDPVAASNVKAYYYVLDQYADTIPSKSAQKLPGSDKALLVANQPAGAIRFLHLIAEDTAGYLTQKAAHFRVQIGPEPGKGGVSGAIREAGSTPPLLLDGVEVTLNRGVLSTTSATGGQYFFSGTVWQGGWELRARKAGYQDFVKTITVTAGQNTPLDIQLVKAP
ncbi:MAG: carboxypeptidase regulatory-like domain-containing protein, partial [Myxococcales bacterium]|nr:carboxypeptidase regulatory-like domain-containing protein [Myxococcales bacterium]